jgi:CDP-glucose 4,6-dehydratase
MSNPTDLHEAKLLMLDISKAKFQLGWEPRLNIEQTVELTVDWYKRYKTESVFKLCLQQIEKFVQFVFNS